MALREHIHGEPPTPLPATPVDPERELTEWCGEQLERLARSQSIMRKRFAVGPGHPQLVANATEGIRAAGRELGAYVERLDAAGLVATGVDRRAAAAMLMAALISDALGGEELAGVFPRPREGAPLAYARVFLAALGVGGAVRRRGRRATAR